MSEIYNRLMQGIQMGEAGRQQRQQRQFGSALGDMLSGGDRNAAMGVMAQANPAGAMQAQGLMGKMDDQRMSRLGKQAAWFTGLPPDQKAAMYPQLASEAQALGFPVPGEYRPDMDEAIGRLAEQMIGSDIPSGYREFDLLTKAANLSPEDRALAARRELYLDPRPSNAAIGYKTVKGPDGREYLVAVDPREVGAQTIGGGASYGSGVQSPQQPGVGPMFAGLESIAQVTSGQRTPEHNEKVGGVPNSYHLSDQARDILPPGTPEQAQQIQQYAAQNGLEIIDEGDHWHLEPAGRAPQGGVNPFASRRPEDEAAATEAAKRAVGLQFAPAEAQAEAQRTGLVEEAKRGAAAGAKRDEKAIEAQGKMRGILDRQAMVSEAINDALTAPGFDAAFGIDAARGFIPGTDARDARHRVETVLNQVRLNVLSDLKALSPTGGAVGQVSNEEGRIMAGYLGQLDFLSSDEEARRVLLKIKERMASMAQRLQEAQEKDFRDPQQAPQPSSDIDSLLDLYR